MTTPGPGITPAPGSPGSTAGLEPASPTSDTPALASGTVTTANGSTTPANTNGVLRADLASEQFLAMIPRDFAREHLILSQGRQGDTERLAVAESTEPEIPFNIGVRLEVEIETITADGELIARTIDEAYEQCAHHDTNTSIDDDGGDAHALDDDIDRLLAQADRDLLSTQGKGPIVKLVDALLFEALGRNASDVHVQPLEDRTLVRYRFDGVLHTARELPHKVTSAVISRIKIMGRMDIAERRIPQDGRATVNIADRSIDLRISTIPTSYGERAVLRLLDNGQQLNNFDRLGMPRDLAEQYLDRALRANGIILVTGPTGSGKTTTLYSTLNRISCPGVNIMTVEDPIEYQLSTPSMAISQSQINPRKGITFSTALRHILRQDPDIVMVGEIRDVETAQIAIQSSLTGHLVFSTLHTNDAPSTITRLIDLGVEPYLASASLSAILAQRLVRLLHDACSGDGCDGCYGTGYQGRSGLFELLVIDESMRNAISTQVTLSQLRQLALDAGLRTLRSEGQRLVDEGRTSVEEMRRVVEGAA